MQRDGLCDTFEEYTFQHTFLNFERMKTRSFASQIRSGLVAYWHSFQFVRSKQLRHWYLVFTAGAISCMWVVRALLDAGEEWLEVQLLKPLHGKVRAFAGDQGGAGWDWFAGGLEHVGDAFVFLLGLWLQLKLTKFIVLIALSPLFAVFAEVVAQRVFQGSPTPGGKKSWWWSLWRGMKSALLLVGLELLSGMCLGLLFFAISIVLPGIGWAAWWLFPLASGVVSVGFYGAALLDYHWEQRGYDARESFRASVKNWGVSIALGLPFFLSMSIPALGWFVGPLLGGMMGIVASILSNARI